MKGTRYFTARYYLLFGIVFSLFVPSQSSALPWNLPQDLDDTKTTVTFNVDTTWHLVEGKTGKIRGRLWLENAKDFQSVRGFVELPVASFDTDNTSRDKELRSVMAAVEFPMVRFDIIQIDSLCDPSTLKEDGCHATLRGSLTIRDVKKELSTPILVTRTSKGFNVTGSFKFLWADFHVEDPSILIARVHDEVTTTLDVTWPAS